MNLIGICVCGALQVNFVSYLIVWCKDLQQVFQSISARVIMARDQPILVHDTSDLFSLVLIVFVWYPKFRNARMEMNYFHDFVRPWHTEAPLNV